MRLFIELHFQFCSNQMFGLRIELLKRGGPEKTGAPLPKHVSTHERKMRIFYCLVYLSLPAVCGCKRLGSLPGVRCVNTEQASVCTRNVSRKAHAVDVLVPSALMSPRCPIFFSLSFAAPSLSSGCASSPPSRLQRQTSNMYLAGGWRRSARMWNAFSATSRPALGSSCSTSSAETRKTSTTCSSRVASSTTCCTHTTGWTRSNRKATGLWRVGTTTPWMAPRRRVAAPRAYHQPGRAARRRWRWNLSTQF